MNRNKDAFTDRNEFDRKGLEGGMIIAVTAKNVEQVILERKYSLCTL